MPTFALLLLAGCSADGRSPTPLRNAVGPEVRPSLCEFEHTYDYLRDGRIEMRQVGRFDYEGRVERVRTDALSDGVFEQDHNYRYTGDDQLLDTWEEDEDGELRVRRYEYHNGQLVGYEYLDGATDVLLHRVQFEYDEHDRMDTQITYAEDGVMIEHVTTFTYEDNRTTARIDLGFDGTVDSTSVHHFENGREVLSEDWNPDRGLVRVVELTHDAWDRHSATHKTRFHPDGRVKSVTHTRMLYDNGRQVASHIDVNDDGSIEAATETTYECPVR